MSPIESNVVKLLTFRRMGHLSVTTQTGFHPHPPSFMHRFLAKGLGAGMWFFIFYRAR
jgi:hypothetical protein